MTIFFDKDSNFWVSKFCNKRSSRLSGQMIQIIYQVACFPDSSILCMESINFPHSWIILPWIKKSFAQILQIWKSQFEGLLDMIWFWFFINNFSIRFQWFNRFLANAFQDLLTNFSFWSDETQVEKIFVTFSPVIYKSFTSITLGIAVSNPDSL